MKRVSGKNSLALLCILAGIVYLLILVPTVIEGVEGGIQGAKEGFKSSQKTIDEDLYNDFYSESYFLRLKIKDKKNYYPDSILNTTTNEILPARFGTVHVFYQFKESQPLWSILFLMFLMFAALPIMALLVFIPVLFYRLIFSLYRNHVFTTENVKRIQRIGLFCIIVYAYFFLFGLHLYIQAKTAIDLEKYKIAFPELANEMLLFGVVALIVAAVMKRAIAIKEEQELTV
ncbi:Protein of unknown function [Porphyromonadaceae bacterium NLAE-zl-C104]|jgi:hypothetical protein|uniref:DUF2975 domain-containing protein n=1 Tax=Proteiniphilum saccharofermentans TaxID=1642647 RepID=UPI00089BC198|nr:DUF2975 domain-containing protein [Proteiniphilum saccharofermentans]SDZ79766.1 Protein of unknown function [Porphyromonadaceae bacterium KH3R12]SFS85616.1 Protein of unknown function [Porphyromonadaceae bacterium NLAE-zl-C104]